MREKKYSAVFLTRVSAFVANINWYYTFSEKKPTTIWLFNDRTQIKQFSFQKPRWFINAKPNWRMIDWRVLLRAYKQTDKASSFSIFKVKSFKELLPFRFFFNSLNKSAFLQEKNVHDSSSPICLRT